MRLRVAAREPTGEECLERSPAGLFGRGAELGRAYFLAGVGLAEFVHQLVERFGAQFLAQRRQQHHSLAGRDVIPVARFPVEMRVRQRHVVP